MDDPALEPALALGSLHEGCRYFITQVVEPAIPVVTRLAAHPMHLGSDFSERRESVVRNYLAGLSDKLREQGLRVTPQLLVGRGIADRILELAQALGVDCIAVGTHGLRGAERMLLGSVADKIVRGADVPVSGNPDPAPQCGMAPSPPQEAEVAS